VGQEVQVDHERLGDLADPADQEDLVVADLSAE
jgi:hypothetical protein